ncbi:hypothetical protein QBC34DRAFT_82015 [Podospora aff. communis PSN243]|uniref:Uncharacterized protein n=1 Tax=Podospora aff. communis PSN243 TaxID=3040156 RepID=A0AAV9GRZ3_9PEZI|nr:hypothetical protein QBC34DRAFT_82015 [Podospora aff. communis PSN243]
MIRNATARRRCQIRGFFILLFSLRGWFVPLFIYIQNYPNASFARSQDLTGGDPRPPDGMQDHCSDKITRHMRLGLPDIRHYTYMRPDNPTDTPTCPCVAVRPTAPRHTPVLLTGETTMSQRMSRIYRDNTTVAGRSFRQGQVARVDLVAEIRHEQVD